MTEKALIAGLVRAVREARRQVGLSLEQWSRTPEVEGAKEAARAEWQRARASYVEALEMYFEVASGALGDVEDVEAKLEATAKAVAFLGRSS